MNRLPFILFFSTFLILSLPLSAQTKSLPEFTIQLKQNFSIDNLLNYEEVEAVIVGNTLSEKGIKLTLNLDESFTARNKQCKLPVLKANFPRKRLKGSLLEGFNKVEIILNCDSTGVYTSLDKLLLEAWFYKLSGFFFRFEPRVQLVNLKIEGLTDKAIPALFIESPDDMASRYEGRNLEIHLMQPWLLDQEALAEFVIFQYFTGNTCWALETLHSMILLSVPGRPPVPFPWDHSCARLLKEPFAAGFDTCFKSPCVQKDVLQLVIASLNRSRSDILQSIESMHFSNSDLKEELRQYTLKFFETMNNPDFIQHLGISCPEE